LRVAAVASAGNDVVVTILGGPTLPPENVANDINTPNLPAGSVTVLQAPFKKTFTLNMGSKTLTLNKGYKLQDINITSALTTTGSAVIINHPTAGLASVDVTCNASASNVTCVKVDGAGSHILRSVNVTCNGTGSNVTCVKVEGAGSHILKDVTVNVKANSGNVGIKNNANASLSIIGGEVRLNNDSAAITLINSQGVLTATGLTVDMTDGVVGGITNHTKNSTGILLNAAGSLVTNSTIKVNRCALSSGNSIGIDVQHTTGKSTVVGNNFISYATSTTCPTVGVNGSTKLSPDPSPPNNNFSGAFGNTVQ